MHLFLCQKTIEIQLYIKNSKLRLNYVLIRKRTFRFIIIIVKIKKSNLGSIL